MAGGIQQAIESMLSVEPGRVRVLAIGAAETSDLGPSGPSRRLRRLTSDNTGTISVDYAVACGGEAERQQVSQKVTGLSGDAAARTRFAEALSASAGATLSKVDASSLVSGMLDAEWSKADAVSKEGPGGDAGFVVDSETGSSEDRLGWLRRLAPGLLLLPAALLAYLLLRCLCCSSRRRKRGLDLPEESAGREAPEVGKAPDGIGFDPRRFDPRKYMSLGGRPAAGRRPSDEDPLLPKGQRGGGGGGRSGQVSRMTSLAVSQGAPTSQASFFAPPDAQATFAAQPLGTAAPHALPVWGSGSFQPGQARGVVTAGSLRPNGS